MHIVPASAVHLPFLLQHDRHVADSELKSLVARHRILIAEEAGQPIGWLRWNLFWDNTPFMNMLYLLDPHRGYGHGSAMVAQWESDMKSMGYGAVMTSTASDEYAQHFYQKLGYTAIGGFTPFGESYELMLAKKL